MRLLWVLELIKWYETNQALTKNQYGGRKSIHAQSTALNKTLTLDIIIYYGKPVSLSDKKFQALYEIIFF